MVTFLDSQRRGPVQASRCSISLLIVQFSTAQNTQTATGTRLPDETRSLQQNSQQPLARSMNSPLGNRTPYLIPAASAARCTYQCLWRR